MSLPLRVAVIGAGPAGIYAADILTTKDPSATVDIFDRLPTPYGLIRYGVAPDHPRIKQIIVALHKVLERGDIRLLANVDYGVDLKLEDLRQFYDAKHRHLEVAARYALYEHGWNVEARTLLIAYGIALRLGPGLGAAGSVGELATTTALKLVVQPLVAYAVAHIALGVDGPALLAVVAIASAIAARVLMPAPHKTPPAS